MSPQPVPDPFVVCVHPRGGVRYCQLSQHIATCHAALKAGRMNDIEALASAHNYGHEARASMAEARKLLPWKHEPDSGHRNAQANDLPGTGTNQEQP